MLLQKYENLLELSDKQLVIQSSLASSISLGQTMFGVKKNQILMLFFAKLVIFRIQQELSKLSVKKVVIKPNHYTKGLPKSLPSNYPKRCV